MGGRRRAQKRTQGGRKRTWGVGGGPEKDMWRPEEDTGGPKEDIGRLEEDTGGLEANMGRRTWEGGQRRTWGAE